VQKLSFEPELISLAPINRITDDRMLDKGKMDADLMSTARLRLDLQ
jgi:hypothetical protein